MRKPRLLPPIVCLLLAALACNLPVSGGADQPSPSPSAAATASHTPPPAQQPTLQAATEVDQTPSAPPAVPLRLAYIDAGDIWVSEFGGAPKRLTVSGEVAEVHLSDDGAMLVYLLNDPLDNTYELRAVRFDGTGDLDLLTQAELDLLYPLGDFLHYAPSQLGFIPGTHTLMFNTRAVLEGPGLVKNDDLWVAAAETGEFSMLLPPGSGGDFHFSPDANQVALVRPQSVGFARIDGSGLRAGLLTYPSVITYSEYLYYPIPVWDPDGSAVILPLPQEDPFATPVSGTLWRVPADGTPPSQLATIFGDFFRPGGSLPLVAPDLSRIAYFRGATDSQLILANLDGSGEAIYDHGNLQWRGWVPGGGRFAYSKDGGMDLLLGEPGSPPQPLLAGAQLRWVDGSSYLVLSGVPGAWQLMLVRLGQPPSLLASPAGDYVSYDFAGALP